MIKAIVFDMDGLMVDTEPVSRQAWADLLAGFGYVLDDGVYGRVIGRRADETAKILLAAYPTPLSPTELIARKNVRLDALLAANLPVMPGLFELHAEIARRQLSWGVATSSPRAHAEKILSRLGLRQNCGAIAGGDEAAQGKPAPDIYLLAAERLGISPAQCLALEDSAPGCRAAAAAGMRVVAIPNGQTQPADFSFVHAVLPSLH
ncbi:MAG: HAD family hydrolase, partial [Anaerolineae bacterium]